MKIIEYICNYEKNIKTDCKDCPLREYAKANVPQICVVENIKKGDLIKIEVTPKKELKGEKP